MRAGKIAVLVAALAAGVGVVAFVQSELDSARRAANQPQAAAPQVEEPKAQILVAAATLGRGATIKPEDLKWLDFPENAVAEGFVTQQARPSAVADLTGSMVRQQIVAGEPILDGKLVKLDSRGMMSAILRDEMRALAISVAPETGAGGFILPGDYVDVILTREDTVEVPKRGGGFREQSLLFTDTLFRNVRVLAIDTSFDKAEDPAIEPKRTATLEVFPDMAEMLSLAERAGRITLALRAFADTVGENGEMPQPEVVIDIERMKSTQIGRLGRDEDYEEAEEEEEASGPSQVLVVRGSNKTATTVD